MDSLVCITEAEPLNSYIIIMEDGTISKVRAGSYALTIDNHWTFWKERHPNKSKSTPIVSIKARPVYTIADERYYEGEAVMAHMKGDKATTQLRKVSKTKTEPSKTAKG